jgi:uncharacterized protein (TIGR02118 family)
MADDYVKLVVLLKKKPGMSFEDFQDYYENHHSKLITLLPRVQRYFRRYLHPLDGHPMNTDDEAGTYHVITELWFNSREDLDVAMARNAEPDVYQALADDELNLFDRSQTRINIVEERFSDLTVDVPAVG